MDFFIPHILPISFSWGTHFSSKRITLRQECAHLKEAFFMMKPLLIFCRFPFVLCLLVVRGQICLVLSTRPRQQQEGRLSCRLLYTWHGLSSVGCGGIWPRCLLSPWGALRTG